MVEGNAFQNTIFLSVLIAVGTTFGFFLKTIINRFADLPRTPPANQPTESDKRQFSTNVAILYATLMLVIAAVISDWPPEGQNFPAFMEEIMFFGSVLVTAVIVGRVIRLIVALETKLIAE